MFKTLIDIFKTILFLYIILFVLSLPLMGFNIQPNADIFILTYLFFNTLIIISLFLALKRITQNKKYVYILILLALGVIAIGAVYFIPLSFLGAFLGATAAISLLKYPTKK